MRSHFLGNSRYLQMNIPHGFIPGNLLLVASFYIALAAPKAAICQVLAEKTSIVNSYKEILPYFPEIHVGTQYVQENRHVDGHPFYHHELFGMGKITLGGFSFIDTPLQYDIVKDQVITMTPIKNQKSIIDPNKIEAFILGDSSTFVKIPEELASFHHGNGFYREVVNGRISLYCKHYKEIVKDRSPMSPFNSFLENKKYYIYMDNAYYSVRNRKDTFKLLQISKKAIKPEIRAQALTFKKDKETYLKIMVIKALESGNVQE
nr:hypothetical protein [Cytophagales bacterium]